MNEGRAGGEERPEVQTPGEQNRPVRDAGDVTLCEVCGGEMVHTAACKLRCFRCGYVRDCSDP